MEDAMAVFQCKGVSYYWKLVAESNGTGTGNQVTYSGVVLLQSFPKSCVSSYRTDHSSARKSRVSYQ